MDDYMTATEAAASDNAEVPDNVDYINPIDDGERDSSKTLTAQNAIYLNTERESYLTPAMVLKEARETGDGKNSDIFVSHEGNVNEGFRNDDPYYPPSRCPSGLQKDGLNIDVSAV